MVEHRRALKCERTFHRLKPELPATPNGPGVPDSLLARANVPAKTSAMLCHPGWRARVLSLICFINVSFTAAIAAAEQQGAAATKGKMESIRVKKEGTGFAFSPSGLKFTPWGFNYDHDASNRLLEQYWKEEWETVVGDFQEMKALGATTVRIHLQVSRFMTSVGKTDPESLALLARLLTLAEKTGLYLDITGLGCYDKKEVPGWYNELKEGERWAVQARFWEAVARTCKASPAVFCYDLMNEPVVSEDKKDRDWTPGAFGDRYFVQRLTLDFAGRTPEQIAKAWVDKLVAAIRRHDPDRLVTVGAIPWALTWPNAKPLFYSRG
jgi:aryl-phospho-beta-D-glucosidase BglC (GH1 family)